VVQSQMSSARCTARSSHFAVASPPAAPLLQLQHHHEVALLRSLPPPPSSYYVDDDARRTWFVAVTMSWLGGKPYRLFRFSEIPDYMKHNRYAAAAGERARVGAVSTTDTLTRGARPHSFVLTGYRVHLTMSQAFRSLFDLHNGVYHLEPRAYPLAHHHLSAPHRVSQRPSTSGRISRPSC